MSNQVSSALRALCAAGLTLMGVSTVSAQAVFPGAVGFGSQTAAGRNGTVVRVTSLLDSGTGTLRAAVAPATCPGTPRVVIFDVSGIIRLQSHAKIRCANTTVAGQTAPAPGIMLEGADLQVVAPNVLVQHIHARAGKEHPSSPSLANRSGISIDGCCTPQITNVVIDHVSIAWSPDQNFSTWSQEATGAPPSPIIQNVTLSNSLLAEGLRYSCPFGTQPTDPEWEYCHPDMKIANPDPDGHSTGPLIGKKTENVSLIRNISAFNRWRNPMVRDTSTNVQIANNFLYWGRYDEHTRIRADTAGWTNTSSVRGNAYILEPNYASSSRSKVIDAEAALSGTTVNLFVADNFLYNHNISSTGVPGVPFRSPAPGGNPWLIVSKETTGTGTVTELDTEPAQFTNLNVPLMSSDRVETVLTSTAGARSAFRDPIDQRVIEDIASRVANRGYGTGGGYVSDPAETGGYPDWPDHIRSPGIVVPAAGNSDNDAYTDVEEWLHMLAYRLEGDQRIARFDSFEDGDRAGWYVDNGTAWDVVTDGATKVLTQPILSGAADMFLTRSYFYDQVVQARIKPTAFEAAGRFARVYARYRDSGNAYYVTLRSPNVVEIKKLVDGTASLLATSTALTISTTDWYSVRFALAPGVAPTPETATVLTATIKNLTSGQTVTLTAPADTNPLPPGFVAVGTYYATARFDDVFVSPVSTTTIPQVTEDFDDGIATDWTNTGGSWSVVSSGGSSVHRQSDATALLLARSSWNGTLAGANQSVQATVKPLAFTATSFVSVHARFVDPNNNYYVTLRNTGVFQLRKVVAGEVVMSEQAPLPSSFKLLNPHTLRIDVTGTTEPMLTGYLDGVPLLKMTDSSGSPFASAGKAAIGTFGATAEFDNVVASTPP